MRPILWFLGLLTLSACHKDRVDSSASLLPITVDTSQSACLESRPVIRRVTSLTGRVSFSQQTGLYFITRSVPGTYDSVWIGFVCNLPVAYQVEGREVVFSGEYRDGADTATPWFSGQEFYLLYLTEIH